MSDAMKSIVDAYVGLENWLALEEMRRHRQELRDELCVRTDQGFDFGLSVRALDEDLQEIDDAFARLQG